MWLLTQTNTGTGTSAGGDAVLHPDPRHVVFLDHDAPRLQLSHLRLDVVDLPKRLAGLRCARVAGRIHEDVGAAAFVDHTAAILLPGREPEGLLVESPRALEVGSADIRTNRPGGQHRMLLR